MQCPKCKYEPTMSEMQRSPDDCVKCGINYSGFAASSARRVRPEKIWNEKGRFGIFKAAFLAATLAAIALAAFKYYEYRQAVTALEQNIRLTSAYTEQVITSLEQGGAMTFAELFSKITRSIEEVDALLVRTSVIDGADSVKERSMIYMRRAQDVMRGVSTSTRKMMDLSSATDRFKAAERRIESAEPGYQYSHARESRLEALNEQISALEAVKETRIILSDMAIAMKGAAADLEEVDQGALLRPPLYEKLKFTK